MMEFNSAILLFSMELNAVFVLMIVLIAVIQIRKKRHTNIALKNLVDSVSGNRRKRRQQIEKNFNESIGEEASWITDRVDNIVRTEVILFRSIVDSFFHNNVEKIEDLELKVADFSGLYEELIVTVSKKMRNDLQEATNEIAELQGAKDNDNRADKQVDTIRSENIDKTNSIMNNVALEKSVSVPTKSSDTVEIETSSSSQSTNRTGETPNVVSNNGLDELPSELLEMGLFESSESPSSDIPVKEAKSFDLSEEKSDKFSLESLLGDSNEESYVHTDEKMSGDSTLKIDDSKNGLISEDENEESVDVGLLEASELTVGNTQEEDTMNQDPQNIEDEDDDPAIDELLDFDSIMSDVELEKYK